MQHKGLTANLRSDKPKGSGSMISQVTLNWPSIHMYGSRGRGNQASYTFFHAEKKEGGGSKENVKINLHKHQKDQPKAYC